MGASAGSILRRGRGAAPALRESLPPAGVPGRQVPCRRHTRGLRAVVCCRAGGKVALGCVRTVGLDGAPVRRGRRLLLTPSHTSRVLRRFLTRSGGTWARPCETMALWLPAPVRPHSACAETCWGARPGPATALRGAEAAVLNRGRAGPAVPQKGVRRGGGRGGGGGAGKTQGGLTDRCLKTQCLLGQRPLTWLAWGQGAGLVASGDGCVWGPSCDTGALSSLLCQNGGKQSVGRTPGALAADGAERGRWPQGHHRQPPFLQGQPRATSPCSRGRAARTTLAVQLGGGCVPGGRRGPGSATETEGWGSAGPGRGEDASAVRTHPV